ncbi:MAG: flavin reductase family protein [Bacteriovoracia bacterium]
MVGMTRAQLDPKQLGGPAVYKIMIGAIVPRPIAWVSTISVEGVTNVAPFSFFNGVASNPPSLMFSITRKSDGGKKDSLRNIEATGEFVVNIAHEASARPLHETSAEYPYGVSEFTRVGLTALPSRQVRAPGVAEAPIQLECRLHQKLEIGAGGPGSATIIVGEIIHIQASTDVYANGKIAIEKLRPIARLAGRSYTKLGEVFEQPAPEIKT